MKNHTIAFTALSAAVALGAGAVHAASAQDDAKGFVEGSTLNLLNRLVYEELNYKNGSTFRAVNGQRGNTQAQESGYGAMLNYQSGYTRGTVGFGLDAHAYGGLNLDTQADGARANPRYVAKHGKDIADSFGRAGAALKVRVASTELKAGEFRTKNPIFHSSDSRLLPETNRGWQITSQDISSLSLQAGRFTEWADRNARKNGNDLLANYSGQHGDAFAFAGGTWKTPIANLSLTSYVGQYEDNWNTWYVGGFYMLPLADKRSLSFNLNVYRSTDTGAAKSGEISTTTWNLMATYALGAHKIGLGYQKVNGNNPFDYVNRGSIWLDNGMQLSDFNGPKEASWQLKYDVDLAQWTVPGLSAGVAYIRGSGVDYRRMNTVYASYLGYAGNGGKHWERDVLVRYVVQNGTAKGMNLQLRYGVHRANKAQGEANINQVRLQAEMPVNIF